MISAGLKPAIPGSVGRCLIHWATRPSDCRDKRYHHVYPHTHDINGDRSGARRARSVHEHTFAHTRRDHATTYIRRNFVPRSTHEDPLGQNSESTAQRNQTVHKESPPSKFKILFDSNSDFRGSWYAVWPYIRNHERPSGMRECPLARHPGTYGGRHCHAEPLLTSQSSLVV